MWCSAVGCLVTLTLSLLVAPLAAEAQQLSLLPTSARESRFSLAYSHP
jgi:hypothetical protein